LKFKFHGYLPLAQRAIGFPVYPSLGGSLVVLVVGITWCLSPISCALPINLQYKEPRRAGNRF